MKYVMKVKYSFLFLAVIIASIGCSQSQSKTRDQETEIDKKSLPVIQSFFKKMESGEYKIAVDYLLAQNDNIGLQDSGTINLKLKFNQINENGDHFISQKLIRKKGIDNDLCVYSYFVKYERKYYRFIFVFYNNDKDTKITRFSFDDAIDVELEEAIKLYSN
jgi:hypothetical protein